MFNPKTLDLYTHDALQGAAARGARQGLMMGWLIGFWCAAIFFEALR